MPDPALPTRPDGSAVTVTINRVFEDPSGRPMTGTLTATPIAPPRITVVSSVVDGRTTIRLRPGRYTLSAMLRTVGGDRAYTTEEITVTEEDS